MGKGRVWMVILGAVALVEGALMISELSGAASAQTPPEKPVVYNHITEAGAALDQLVHQTYEAEFKVVDFRDQDGVYVAPQLKYGFPPKAPFDSKKVPIEGRVVAVFIVTAEGRVAKPVILQSTDRRLNSAVFAALDQWEFVPARIDGRNVSTTGGEEFDIRATP